MKRSLAPPLFPLLICCLVSSMLLTGASGVSADQAQKVPGTAPAEGVRKVPGTLGDPMVAGDFGDDAGGDGESVAALEQRIFGLVNAARQQTGVKPLKLVESLSAHARHHSERMRDAGFLGHDDPQLGGMTERADAAGIGFLRLAENVAYAEHVDHPAETLHGYILTSPGHRANLLDGDLTHVGIGVAVRGSEVWLTEVFVNPRAGGLR